MYKKLFLKNLLPSLFLLLWTSTGLADTDLAKYFANKSGCFILYDLNRNTVVEKYNSPRCSQQISPNSTFKIALSLMAFDQKLITQKTIFKWDGQHRMLPVWNQDQTPQTWLKNSVVWVSQVLTPQLGMTTIKSYLYRFKYGNQDFSGGLAQAWLNNSLKISADEQLEFLKKLVSNKLPVSQQAMTETKANMYVETLPSGWKLYGKTGAGNLEGLQDGWFVGFIQKDKQTEIFVLNFSDLQKVAPTAAFAGVRAKEIVKEIIKSRE